MLVNNEIRIIIGLIVRRNEYQKVITAVILTNIILDQTQFNTKPKQPK